MESKVIAIAAADRHGLAGEVSAHFGRCPAYVLAHVTESGEIVHTEVVENPGYENHRPGQAPHFIHALGAHVILAGGMGPRAVEMFRSAGIEVATGAVGRVESVLQAYLRGEIQGIVPCTHDHPDSCGHHGGAAGA